MLYRERGK